MCIFIGNKNNNKSNFAFFMPTMAIKFYFWTMMREGMQHLEDRCFKIPSRPFDNRRMIIRIRENDQDIK